MRLVRDRGVIVVQQSARRMLDYSATPEGSREVMMRASHNVSAHRRHGAKMSEEFFSPGMDDLDAIDPRYGSR